MHAGAQEGFPVDLEAALVRAMVEHAENNTLIIKRIVCGAMQMFIGWCGMRSNLVKYVQKIRYRHIRHHCIFTAVTATMNTVKIATKGALPK